MPSHVQGQHLKLSHALSFQMNDKIKHKLNLK